MRPGHSCNFLEYFDLRERVLAVGRVEHQHHVVRGLGIEASEHPADLGQFFHQFALVLEPSGGVHDQRVDTLVGRGFDRVEHDARRIALLRPPDEWHAEPVCPDRKLADGGGAESVARRQHHRIVLLLQQVRELGDGGGLARTVDADHEDHLRAGKGNHFERLGDGAKDFGDLARDHLHDRAVIGIAIEAFVGKPFANPRCRARAEIRR